MKRFFSRKFLGIPMALIAIILTTTLVLAAWGVINLTSTGSITIDDVVTQEISVDTSVLVFGNTNVDEGAGISVTSAIITITNDGEADITGLAIVVSDLPAGISLATPNVTAIYPLVTNDTATFTVTLTGTAPAFPATIVLTGITATLTAS